jgi:hypothetical protein
MSISPFLLGLPTGFFVPVAFFPAFLAGFFVLVVAIVA